MLKLWGVTKILMNEKTTIKMWQNNNYKLKEQDKDKGVMLMGKVSNFQWNTLNTDQGMLKNEMLKNMQQKCKCNQ